MRRNTKTMYEWRKAYRDKEELMLERGFPEVSPHEFYRDLAANGNNYCLPVLVLDWQRLLLPH